MSSLDAAVDEAVAAYVSAHPRSRTLAEQAAVVLPGANTRSVLHIDPFRDVLDRGWSDGATSESERAFAASVVDRFASIEQVRFTNSGTETNLMALLTARQATGRSRFVVFEHAHHGAPLHFGPDGATMRLPLDVAVLAYNDLMAAFDPGHATPALARGGTFSNNAFTMAVGAAIGAVVDATALAAVNERGERLRDGLNARFESSSVGFCASGWGSLPNVHPVPGPVRCERRCGLG